MAKFENAMLLVECVFLYILSVLFQRDILPSGVLCIFFKWYLGLIIGFLILSEKG